MNGTIAQLLTRLYTRGIALETVGENLKVDAPQGALNPGLIRELKENKKEIIRYLQQYEGRQEHYFSIEPAEKKEYYPLTPAQKRLYVLQQLEPDSTAYNMPYNLPLKVGTDLERLEHSFQRLIQRHESLRTSFRMIDDTPVQQIHDRFEFSIKRIDPTSEDTDRINSVQRSFVQPFDLNQVPLIRVGIIEIRGSGCQLMVDMHHIIADGSSQEILTEEFMAFFNGEDSSLAPPGLQYKDYSQWLSSEENRRQVKRQEDYWLRTFAGELPVLALPLDRPRPPVQSFAGGTVDFSIDEEGTAGLQDVAQVNGATLYMVLLSLIDIFLSKLSGQSDIVVGTPISGRSHPDLEPIIGMFVNTLAMRNYPESHKTFDTFLKEVIEQTVTAFKNQDYPFEDLVERLEVRRDTSRNPIFDVMFNLLNMAGFEEDISIISGKQEQEGREEGDLKGHRQTTSKFDLNFTAFDTDSQVRFELEYCSRLFDPGTIDRFIGYFIHLIKIVIKDPGMRIGDMDVVPQVEKEIILQMSNGVQREIDEQQTIHGWFETCALKTPDRTAVIGPGGINRISYAELERRACGLASILHNLGAQPGEIIGIMVERSIDMIIGILAILKAGGAYLPLDTQYPDERKRYMIKDSAIKLMLVNSSINSGTSFLPEDVRIIHIEEKTGCIPAASGEFLSRTSAGGSNPLYVLYTSGSTGKPKGVVLEHRNLVNLLVYIFDYTSLDCSRILQFTSISFDVSFQEIFSALLSGGQLYLIDNIMRGSFEMLFTYVNRHQVNTLSLPMTFIKTAFGEAEYIRLVPNCVRHIQTAGEQVVIGELFRDFLKLRKIWLHNHYGPTEAHVVTALTLKPEEDLPSLPSIGRPVANTAIFILDRWQYLCPQGVAGELTIGGIQVGKGYLNKPELTDDAFVNLNGSAISKRVYKTGDLARWLSCGNIEFLGRIDHQVKIRGFRVELGGIESVLLTHDRIKDAVVVARQKDDGDKHLCAYFVPSEPGAAKIELEELREFLARSLPDYMIPSYFTVLDRIPVTPNGKIDRRSLPEPERKAGGAYIKPRTGIERKLVKIWSDVLGVQHLGIDDNFFHLGGHSLKATVLASRIHRELNVRIPLQEIFRRQTIREITLFFETNSLGTGYFTAIQPIEKRDFYPVSSAQKRLYVLQQLDTDTVVYNISAVFQLSGRLDKARLEDVFQLLLQRHESLRTSFHMIGDRPVQRVHDIENNDFRITTYRQSENDKLKIAAVIRDFIRPFDLSRAPLIRIGIIGTTTENCLFIVDMHHIISDGVSIANLTDDFTSLFIGNKLPALGIQYKDYTHWQQEEENSEYFRLQREFWLEKYRDGVPVLDLPTDNDRTAIQNFDGARVFFEVTAEGSRRLKVLALERAVTLYSVLLAIFNVFLAKITGQDRVVVGTPVVGRRHTDLEKIIGMFVNTLALINYPEGNSIFNDFLMDVNHTSAEALENQDYPFEELVEQVAVERDLSRNPMFDVMFTMQSPDLKRPEIPGIKLTPYRYELNAAKFDLTLECSESNENLLCTFEYSTTLFNENTVQRFTRYLNQLISAVLENPNERISQLEIIPDAEKEKLLILFNDTGEEYPRGKTIHQLFEEQVDTSRDQCALISRQLQVTYGELNRKTNQLAHLLQGQGVGPGSIVAVKVDRSVELVVGIMGILKAGSAYLPIDPGYPGERIDYMLTDSNARVLLTTEDLSPESLLVFNSQPVVVNADPAIPAYVIYTSGSTGKPKGVLVEHQAVLNTLYAMDETYPFVESDVYLFKTTFTFDVSVMELFGWFVGGGSLAILEIGGEKKPQVILDSIKTLRVTHLNFVPSMFNAMVESSNREDISQLDTLRYIFLAGEALPSGVVKRFREFDTNIVLENIYGPTEAAVYASIYSLAGWDSGRIPIGRPLQNVKLYILDASDRLLPIGTAGELHIGGAGLSRGYLNRPELTAERFVHVTLNTNRLMLYKTGDLARWLPDGNIEFLGRIDHQVKVRGFRIELGEIENRIARYPGVGEAVVAAPKDGTGETYLCAYYVALDVIDVKGLKHFMALYLPDYMIPSYVVRLDHIPLNRHGKVDRSALPAPVVTTDEDYAAPIGAIETNLTEIWSRVLDINRDEIGRNHNFFQLGGHSLKATILVALIHKELNADISLGDLFLNKTIAQLSRYITDRFEIGCRYYSIEPVESKQYYTLSPAQERLFLLHRMVPDSVRYNLSALLIVEGEIDGQRFTDVFRQLIQDHESLRTSFHVVSDRAVQVVHDAVDFSVTEIESIGPTEEIISGFIRPFDLTQAPLLRAGLLKYGEKAHLLMVDLHHIICDGFSLGIIIHEFALYYEGKSPERSVLQYKDFVCWQKRKRELNVVKQQENFWLNEFAGELPVLELPTDHPRPRNQRFEGSIETFRLGVPAAQDLKALAAEMEVTLYMLLLAVYNVFLARICCQESVVVGTSVSGRNHADLECVVGMFVNTLALKTQPTGERTFGDYMAEVKKTVLSAFTNQDFQYDELVEKLAVSRDQSRNPLFDTMFLLHNMDIPELTLHGLKLRPLKIERSTAKFDLTLECIETDNDISCIFEYSTVLFNKETIQRFVGYLRQLIASVRENPGECLAWLDIIPDNEKKRLLIDFNATEQKIPIDRTIYGLFEERVDAIPDKPALVSRDRVATYRFVDEKANQLANYLHQEPGVQQGDLLAVIMERSIRLIIALLGVMKAGAAYVPLDPDLPVDRLRLVINDASVNVVISQRQFREKLLILEKNCDSLDRIVNLDDPENGIHMHTVNRPGIQGSANPAYIMYTSGSTGVPKGVLVEHRTIVNTLMWRKNFYEYALGDVSLQIPPYFFDSAITDIFTPILGGARLVMLSKNERVDLNLLQKIIPRQGVTHFIAVPVFYNVLLEEVSDAMIGLKMICCAGEHFPDELIRKHFEKIPLVRIVNEYGPTENSVNSTAYELLAESARALIGKPISNVSVTILDRNQQLCPIGVGGEIYLGGGSLARGYLNRPELTAETFIFQTINTKHSRLYKTGDMARWLADGNLEFLGRLDNQVKIRGIRVEVEEIENLLMKHNDIKEAVVLAREDSLHRGERYLCAYVVYSDGKRDAGINDYLAKRLPEYMIPSHTVELAAIPFTVTGKIDRGALPQPDVHKEVIVPPGSRIEKKLAAIWAAVLTRDIHSIGIDSDFFHLGGNSLLAATAASRIHKTLGINIPLMEMFTNSTIREQAKYVDSSSEIKFRELAPVELRDYYPLSAAQKRLYILQQMGEQGVGTAYNLPLLLVLEGPIHYGQLETTFRYLIQRHESLRTSFQSIGDQPVQVVHDDVDMDDFSFEYFDMTTEYCEENGKSDINGDLKIRIIRSFIRPFDLSLAPLLRAGFLKIEEKKHLLLLDMHHIITDGTSTGILVREFMMRYGGHSLPVPTLQYRDYAIWQGREFQHGTYHEQEEFWLTEFGDDIPVLELPTDHSRPHWQDFQGGVVMFRLDHWEIGELNAVALQNKATLFMVLLTVYYIFLSKISGQDVIVVGTPASGRRHTDLERVVGMFVNTLALKNNPSGDLTFREFLSKVRVKTLAALANQDYQYEELVERVAVKRDTGRNPLFDTMFSMQNIDIPEFCIPGLTVKPYHHDSGISKFDLSLLAVEAGEDVRLTMEYCSRLFEEQTIRRFVRYIKNLVAEIVSGPDRRISSFQLISEQERQQLLVDFNGSPFPFPHEKSIRQLYLEQTERTPLNIALTGRGAVAERTIHLTYRELYRQSLRVAGMLQEQGVRPGAIVAAMVDRSIETVIKLLGIIYAGAAYLPIDPEYPEDRIEFMLKDSSASILLSCEVGELENRGNFEIIGLNELFNRNSRIHSLADSPNELCYVIYTSGTTGRPKGVMIDVPSVVNLAYCQMRTFKVNKRDKILQFSSLTFDASVEQIFIALFSGAALVLVDKKTILEPQRFSAFISSHAITHIHAVPSFLTAIPPGIYPDLKRVIAGGDKCPPLLAQRWRQDYEFYNEYGPTETTVTSIELRANPEDALPERLPIGRPLDNTGVYILDRWFNMAPIGVTGELYISGAGAARGYLNRPELTAERFIHHRLNSKHLKLYKTGDLCRWLPVGSIEFIGRIDHQVKVRGYRIELGEIESHISRYPGIGEAVAAARKDSGEETYVCAYCVTSEVIDSKKLKKFLARYLPDYMIPAYVVQLERMPLNPHGKVDRNALPAPDMTVDASISPPENEIQLKLQEIWTEVLGVDRVTFGIDDRFFEIGGQSLKAAVMIEKIQKTFSLRIPLLEIFNNPDIRRLADYIQRTVSDRNVPLELAENKEYYRLSPAQERLYVLDRRSEQGTGYNMPSAVMVVGSPDKSRLEKAFVQLIQRHESLRTSFHMIEEKPVQRIQNSVNFSIEYFEITFRGTQGQEDDIHSLRVECMNTFIRPFDLTHAPLLRVGLARLEKEEYLLIVDMHHIVSDGISTKILINEFAQLYQGKELPGLSIQYKDFAEWWNREIDQDGLKRQEAFWLAEFAGELPALELPLDFSRTGAPSFEGESVEFQLNQKETEGLKKLAVAEQVTIYMLLAALLNVLLSKITNQHDIVIGTVTAGRSRIGFESIVGMFVNTLALRNFPDPQKTFAGFLAEVKKNILNALEHQDYPLELLVERLGISGDRTRNPLFDVVFTLIEAEKQIPMELTGLQLIPCPPEHHSAKFDLTVSVTTGTCLSFHLEYRSQLFKKDTIDDFTRCFRELVSAVLNNKDIRLEEISISHDLLAAGEIHLEKSFHF